MRRALSAGVAGLALAASLVAAPVALARHGADDPPGDDSGGRQGGGRADDIRVNGSCTLRSDIKLELKQEDRGVEAEVEVDENRVGKVWKVGIAVAGDAVVSKRAVTRAPSGSFEVRAIIAARAGQKVAAVARRAATGEVCRVAATL
jgi:hypothetical protein